MYGQEVQSRRDDQGRTQPEDDRGFVVIGLLAAAISGFLVGLLVRGELAFAAIVSALVPAAGLAGWRLRQAFPRDGSLPRR